MNATQEQKDAVYIRHANMKIEVKKKTPQISWEEVDGRSENQQMSSRLWTFI